MMDQVLDSVISAEDDEEFYDTESESQRDTVRSKAEDIAAATRMSSGPNSIRGSIRSSVRDTTVLEK